VESSPYEDIYIDLMKGLVSREEEVRFGESFLGNWVEENTCFLLVHHAREW